jgi:hypothetical protein
VEVFTIIKDFIEIFISLGTLILIFIGLQTWKIQLKGENIFKLSQEVLRELRLVLYKINDYRNPFYAVGEMAEAFEKNEAGMKFNPAVDRKMASKYAEFERWKQILDQYFIYEDKILRLMILLNDFNFDKINSKNMKNYILEMRSKRFKKESLDDEKEQDDAIILTRVWPAKDSLYERF